MLRLVVALDCEARPLREHWQLKPLPASGFRLYGNADIRLIVSGPGVLNAATASAYLAGQDGSDGSAAWLNLGVAGHQHLTPGTPLLASSILDGTQCWYPALVIRPPCALGALRTVARPESDYPDDSAYDMEAAGFYPTASRFASAELVQVLKIISDNRDNPISQLDAPRVTALIQEALPVVAELCTMLCQLAGELAVLEGDPPEYQHYLQRWRFSVSQQVQLRRLLQRHQLLIGGEPELPPLTTARAVLRALQQILDALPPQLEGSVRK